MIIGIDVSRYQGEIDFSKMRAAGSEFVYIRLGVGWNKDVNFEVNRARAKASGIPYGYYWLPYPTTRVGALLDQYLLMVGGDWGDLPPAIDVETQGLGLGLFVEWINVAALHSGRKPVFYTRASHFNEYRDDKGLKAVIGEKTDLWIAHYTYDPINKPPNMPKGAWKNYLLHQYSADENSLGKTYGAGSKAIDLNYFNGDAFDFQEFINYKSDEPGEQPGPAQPVALQVRNTTYLSLRIRPEFYPGARPGIGNGETVEITGPMVGTNPGFWPVNYGGFEGYVSASSYYVKLIW